MRRLVRSTAILGVGSIATIVAAILRAKILASRLGPEGTGVLAQLAAFTAVLVPFATLGAGSGVMTMIADARARGDEDRLRRITSTARALTWAAGISLAVLSLALSPWITDAVYRDRAFLWAILLGTITIPLSAAASIQISMLQGHHAVRSMAILNGLVAAITIATIVPMAWFFGVKGAVAQLVLLAIAQVLLGRWLLAPYQSPKPAVPESSVDRSLLRPIARYGGSALLVGLSSTLTVLILRSIIVDKLGLGQNGIYQVCVGVSGLTMPLILNSITATVWPEIAAQPTNEDAGAPMRSGIRLCFLLTTGLAAGLMVGAPVWVPLFYSPKFRPALELLPYQFLGDYFRAAAWMFGIWLVPRNRLRPWVLFDIVYGLVILGAFLFLVDRIGVKATVIAYVLAHVSHAVLHYGLARRAIGFRLGRDNRVLLLASLALLLILLVVRPEDLPGMVIGGILTAAWAALVVKPREWLSLRDIALRQVQRFTARPGAE
ncbi:MAG TPA: oligosaccharide flippase family protein [Candidatus Eisenbacteria bacterium]|nr:oligosaccharide flippase family protein [Candidatus Eisenbacteria bacterium]